MADSRKVVGQAAELARLDRGGMSLDLASLLATFTARRKASGDEDRGVVAYARAVVARAGHEGVEIPRPAKKAPAKKSTSSGS